MIEMLGVLAIIGVLSAGGIMGYSVAMENYKTNKYIEDMRIWVGGLTNIVNNTNRKGSTSALSSLENLCAMNIITGDYCERKNPFGKSFEISFRQFYSANEYVFGDKKISGDLSFVTIWLGGMPFGACVKLLSHNWENTILLVTSQVSITGGYLWRVKLPLSVSDAEVKCKAKEDNISGNWVIEFFFQGNLKNV